MQFILHMMNATCYGTLDFTRNIKFIGHNNLIKVMNSLKLYENDGKKFSLRLFIAFLSPSLKHDNPSHYVQTRIENEKAYLTYCAFDFYNHSTNRSSRIRESN